MRVHYIVIGIVVAGTDATCSLWTDSKMNTPEFPLVAPSLTDNQNGISIKRILRAHNTTIPAEDNEARVFGLNLGFINDVIENVNLNWMLKDLLSKRTPADGPLFATWVNYLNAFNEKNRKSKVSALGVFMKHYGDEGFIKLLVSADNVDSVWATKFKDELVKSWLDQPNHPANNFKMLKLDEAGNDLLTSPMLGTWVLYMKAFNKEYPYAETTMIDIFTKNYGDKKLAMMLEAGKKVPGTEQLATNLQIVQFKRWMPKNTPDDVYAHVLKLESTSSPNADIRRAYHNAYDKAYAGQLFSFNP